MASKEDALKQNGCFYNNYENVAAGIFKTASFFDSRDIVQVKYEMIRAASNAESSITEISNAYGFSRKSYYQILKAFQADGLYALIPHKPGPKKPHKLTDKAAVFIDSFLESNKKAKPKEISAALESEMGISIHPRTIYRYLKKKLILARLLFQSAMTARPPTTKSYANLYWKAVRRRTVPGANLRFSSYKVSRRGSGRAVMMV